jgi:YVTN family beta-propeller protein
VISADVIPAVPPQAAGHVVQAPALPGAQAISSRDRVYTADQVSNTVSVINPKTNEVLGTIPLGHDRLDQILGPVDRTQVNVHGLGFSRDGHLLDVISVTSNAAQLIRTRSNAVSTSYVGRSPHEGFVAPDGRTLWVAVRGQRYVAVLSTRTGREVRRIATADGPSKVVFSPGGRFAYVNHVRAPEVDVVRVRDRRIVKRIHGVAPRSSDEAISPDGRELWLGHPFDGKTTVVDARRMRVLRILNTGSRTNHPNFVSKADGHAYAYVTVAGLDEVLSSVATAAIRCSSSASIPPARPRTGSGPVPTTRASTSHCRSPTPLMSSTPPPTRSSRRFAWARIPWRSSMWPTLCPAATGAGASRAKGLDGESRLRLCRFEAPSEQPR